MKTLILLSLVLFANLAQADVLPPQTSVTITGADATKIAYMGITGGDQTGTYASFNGKINCVEKSGEANFTCVVQVSK
jgi:hypothetical protein